jgi:hypothetical protein
MHSTCVCHARLYECAVSAMRKKIENSLSTVATLVTRNVNEVVMVL